ncbi:MAG: phosphomethylpyrimidine synthase ThiC [Candidatus Aenigmatarchaeota archaeon]|nr:MAG: phosphomethylpyrimidine synthase ThiC [Candidatus Aenigmarchaeota archaeon]
MTTQLERAKDNEVTKEIEYVAKDESVDVRNLRENVAEGYVVIPASRLHKGLKPIGIGRGLRIKINSNIGTSPAKFDIKQELEKLRVSIESGADTVMDLSTGGDIDKVRREILRNSKVPIGTVPIYQAVVEKGSILDLSENDFIRGIRKHIEDGVDFITVHSGVKKEAIPLVKKRLMGVVSRGGSFLIKWMEHHNRENPLYTNFDKILKLAYKHDVTLSLGDGLRPGCVKDATDEAQIHELRVLGELADAAFRENVQAMIEGPGHIPLHEIKKNIDLQKKMCKGKPFYVLGPIVTDVAPGYDHITSAIGGALAAYYGADFLCYVTPREHLGLPTVEDVREGVIASRIAAHSADLALGRGKEWDDKMSEARANLDWGKMFELAMDPGKAKRMREECSPKDPKTCSMCDRFCSVKISKELREKK